MALVFSLLSISFVTSLVSAKLVLEEGYVVTTVIDGHKLGINPYTAHARSGSFDLIILDSKASTFYSASLPLSQGRETGKVENLNDYAESGVKRLAGDGFAGYQDGELGQAQFNMSRSFAVDAKGNVYVADKKNKAIRKISQSGTVTTIAGGISQETGRRDGAAQNATFSADFELTFVPQGCYLLVSDHGNQLLRQINLKEEDCTRTSHSTLGTASVWAIGLLVSCLLGIVFGIAVRPYVIPNEGWNLLSFLETWKLLHLISWGKRALTFFSAIRNEAAKVEVHSLIRKLFQLIVSHLLLMFRLNHVKYMFPPQKTVDLRKFGNPSSSDMSVPEMISEDLKDLISFEDTSELFQVNKEAEARRKDDVLCNSEERIDRMIQSHINGLGKSAEENLIRVGSSSGSALVKRR